FPADDALVAAMDRVREVASSGLALRKARGLRVRLPLAGLTVVSPSTGLEAFAEVLRDELNVKAVDVRPLEEGSLAAYGITRRLSVNARALGPRVGRDVQRVIQASKSGDWSLSGDVVTAGGTVLEPGEFELELDAAEASSAIAFLGDGGFVILDTVTTPELEAEGLARDVIRTIQDTRKAAGLEVSDRIVLQVKGSSESDLAALTAFAEVIAAETLAVENSFQASADPETSAALDSSEGARTVLAAGQAANAGVLVVDVWKSGAVDV
ncbi:MAG: DUF5915 domain-containing protein, partial [Rhodoglobus sp.]